MSNSSYPQENIEIEYSKKQQKESELELKNQTKKELSINTPPPVGKALKMVITAF